MKELFHAKQDLVSSAVTSETSGSASSEAVVLPELNICENHNWHAACLMHEGYIS